jgi:predicted nucleic acid-binding protein
VSIYLDTSVIISHFVDDANSARADALIAGLSDDIIFSDLCAAEFAAGLSRLVRMAELTADVAQATFSNFDIWAADVAQRVNPTPADWVATERLLRRLDFPLRTPDMLHIVIVGRLGAELATFDDHMQKVATTLGLPVAAG